MRNKGKWSKHGGGIPTLLPMGEQWVCQSCASTLTNTFKRHEFPYENFMIGVCDYCKDNKCEFIQMRLKTINASYYL